MKLSKWNYRFSNEEDLIKEERDGNSKRKSGLVGGR